MGAADRGRTHLIYTLARPMPHRLCLHCQIQGLCSAKLMRPSRGLWHPAILVMQSTQNGRRDHSASRREVMALGNQRVLCG